MEPAREIDAVPRGVAAWAQAMGATRGDVRRFRRVFGRTLMPMALLDANRANVDANRALRLLFRISLAELRKHRVDDFTPERDLPKLHAAWETLLRDGSVTGRIEVDFPDGGRLQVVYAALRNVFPGHHLGVCAPADWPEDELGAVDLDGVAQPAGEWLSSRELEVLTRVAAGLDLRDIAEELTISPATVKTHVRNALVKLGARNRPHGVALAMHLGLIDLPAEVGGRDTLNPS
jgi:DNA-binding CsgD family transcriptional regulator